LKDEVKTKAELIKELKILRKEREKDAFKDITERIQVEKGLKDSEEHLKILFDYAPDAYYISDLKGKFIDGNKAAERLVGYKKEELIGKNFLKLKLLSLNDIPKAAKLLAKNLRRLPTGPDEFVLNRKDNSKVIVEISTFPVKIRGRALALGIARDITERKKAEKALADSEEKYRTVFENTGTATIIIEEDKTISMVNNQSEKMYGYSKEEIENRMKWTDFVIPEDLERMKKYHIARRKAGEKAPTEYEFRLIDKKGNIKDIFLKIGMILGTKKSVASLMDITKRKKAEERVKHLNLVLRAIRSVNQLIVKEKNRESLLKGACNNLIKTRGYHSAWIALLNEGGKLETYAEASLGKAFLPIVEMLKKGEFTVCGNKALKQQKVVITKDPASTCTECPLAQEYSGRGAMTIRLEHSGKVYGFASVSIPTYLADNQEEQSLFKEVAGDIALGIQNIELVEERKQAEQKLKTTYQKLKKTMDAAIDTMSKIIEAKDPYTSGHQHRVCQLAVPLARELGLPEDKIEGIRIASLIHDVGKIGLPTEILSKPGKLTDIEFSLIKDHSQVGHDILKSIDFSYPIAQIVLQHHERLDGSGYPSKLKGDEIMLEAKIIGVADVVEAMSSFRPYRPAKGIDAALGEISKNKGVLYDPEVVDACLKLFKEKGFKFN